MEMCLSDFVGVIDSGVGGLTILQQLQNDFPACNFVYLADSAYCPYGTRQSSEILSRVSSLVSFLQRCGVQAVVIACNTASVYAEILRRQFNLPIFDVIAPTCERVVSANCKRVALLATKSTVQSQIYQQKLNASGVTVISFACSEFVPFVESGRTDAVECDIAVDNALRNLSRCNVDGVILGCTHFPILRKKIAPYVCEAKIVECCTNFKPTYVCNDQLGRTLYLTTGEKEQANSAARWFGKVDFSHVNV